MKKLMCLIFLCLVCLVACGKQEKIQVHSFSYAADCAMRLEDSPGVKTDGFVNVLETQVKSAEDAIQLAKNECTVSWDTVSVAFDSQKEIWRVSFYTEDIVGGDQTVYLNGNGKTIRIVYGE